MPVIGWQLVWLYTDRIGGLPAHQVAAVEEGVALGGAAHDAGLLLGGCSHLAASGLHPPLCH